jgi:type I restriction enzyme R subunit
MAAQDCLPSDTIRDAFAGEFNVLAQLWEALSPDPFLLPFEADYRWISQVYVSVQPTSGKGKLLWHTLGAKTIELIHQNVHVEAIRDDLETLVVDEKLLELVLGSPDPKQKAKEIEFKLTARLRKHLGNPKYRALSERLENLKARYEAGVIESVAFLKELLAIAKDLVATERETPPAEDEDRGKAALTELFQQARKENTPAMVERIVKDIDEIVRLVRFPGWQQTAAGEREVKHGLRKTLLKYQLHQDAELFEKAYGYVKQYY